MIIPFFYNINNIKTREAQKGNNEGNAPYYTLETFRSLNLDHPQSDYTMVNNNTYRLRDAISKEIIVTIGIFFYNKCMKNELNLTTKLLTINYY